MKLYTSENFSMDDLISSIFYEPVVLDHYQTQQHTYTSYKDVDDNLNKSRLYNLDLYFICSDLSKYINAIFDGKPTIIIHGLVIKKINVIFKTTILNGTLIYTINVIGNIYIPRSYCELIQEELIDIKKKNINNNPCPRSNTQLLSIFDAEIHSGIISNLYLIKDVYIYIKTSYTSCVKTISPYVLSVYILDNTTANIISSHYKIKYSSCIIKSGNDIYIITHFVRKNKGVLNYKIDLEIPENIINEMKLIESIDQL